MQLRRFTSGSTSKALQAVREAFGDEAVILSNRQVNGQVEIIATGTFDENAVMATATASEIVSAVPTSTVPADTAGSAAANDAAPTPPSAAAEPATTSMPESVEAPVSAFVPENVSVSAPTSAPESAPAHDDAVTVSLSDTARAAAAEVAGDESSSSSPSHDAASSARGPGGSEPAPPSTADADTGGGATAEPASPAIDTISAIDSLSRDLEAMSDDERPLTLGPVSELDAQAMEREAQSEREPHASSTGGAGSGGWRADDAAPHQSVPAVGGADEDAHIGPSTVAAIGQVLAVAERRHAERARRLEQRLLRLEVNLWGELEPLRSAHLRQLVRLGVGMELAVRLVERITADMTAKNAMRQSLALLKATLPVGIDGSGRAPGVTVLSGPAGGGKTTALVKLATQQVRLHGAQSTVLVAADARRIGAFESLQAFGRLLGVPVVQARSAEELAEHITAFAHKPLVLVDHLPLDMADTLPLPAADSLGDCDGVKRELRRLLVLPATLEPSAFEAQVALHRRHRISHVVLTQVDRATRLASCFAPLIRHALPIAHVSDDSRVLTPLAAADVSTLVATAMTRGQEKASDKDEELLLNLLQPTRRVIESVAAGEASATRPGTPNKRETGESRMGEGRTGDVDETAGSTGDAAGNGAGNRPETALGGEKSTAPPHDGGSGGSLVRQGTLERIVAFEVVDHGSVFENGGAIDTVETHEVIESLGDVPPSLLDDRPSESESTRRRERSSRRARRNANERTNRQETRR